MTSWFVNVVPHISDSDRDKGVKPIVVMTDPVTIEGKSLANFEKTPETKIT